MWLTQTYPIGIGEEDWVDILDNDTRHPYSTHPLTEFVGLEDNDGNSDAVQYTHQHVTNNRPDQDSNILEANAYHLSYNDPMYTFPQP